MPDVSNDIYLMRTVFCEEVAIARSLMTSPSVLYQPKLSIDGNQWCALYGENLAEGVAGFGDTPEAAMADFNRNWVSQKPFQPHPKEEADDDQ